MKELVLGGLEHELPPEDVDPPAYDHLGALAERTRHVGVVEPDCPDVAGVVAEDRLSGLSPGARAGLDSLPYVDYDGLLEAGLQLGDLANAGEVVVPVGEEVYKVSHALDADAFQPGEAFGGDPFETRDLVVKRDAGRGARSGRPAGCRSGARRGRGFFSQPGEHLAVPLLTLKRGEQGVGAKLAENGFQLLGPSPEEAVESPDNGRVLKAAGLFLSQDLAQGFLF